MLNIFTKEGAMQTRLAVISSYLDGFRTEPLFEFTAYDFVNNEFLQKNQVGYSHSKSNIIRYLEEEDILGAIVYV